MALLSAGSVLGIDHVRPLIERSIRNVRRDPSTRHLLSEQAEGEPGEARLAFEVADGRQGFPEGGPYDVMHFGAALSAALLTPRLLDQLKPGGLLLAPIQYEPDSSQIFMAFRKNAIGHIEKERLFSVRYVPMTSYEEQVGN